ncbi:MAG: deoxyribodipyrimidine photolyase [Deltaproteobacteria bacterium]|nr:deoxyribodipyrimidine photolyase [Deltaproteobacteria bacterium]
MVPPSRIRAASSRPVRPDGDYVLLWMIAARRTRWSFALDRALERCRALGKPLLVLEPLRAGYRWASDRIHHFVLDGMRDQSARFQAAGVTYHPYVEPRPDDGRGLLAALAERACVVVTDDSPCFFLPRMIEAAARSVPVLLEAVDGNGIVPIRALDQTFPTAYAFRRALQKTLRPYLGQLPSAEPLVDLEPLGAARIPPDVLARWPRAELERSAALVASLPIDHDVPRVEPSGGEGAGRQLLDRFVSRRLSRYAEDRGNPSDEASSGLSAHLHFGHVSAHEVVHAVLDREDWLPEKLGSQSAGKKEGWWGLSASAEAFLDECVTWRELALNTCVRAPDYDRWESLPSWARATLASHAADPRPHVYSVEQLARAETHDDLWNAAQRQLLVEGRIHNYLRMLWGKKILEWSPGPRDALQSMIELNNRFAIDGRDASSHAGIGWVLGRYDRPWAPERPIFGTIRYMSSRSAMRKLDLEGYLGRWGNNRSLF